MEESRHERAPPDGKLPPTHTVSSSVGGRGSPERGASINGNSDSASGALKGNELSETAHNYQSGVAFASICINSELKESVASVGSQKFK